MINHFADSRQHQQAAEIAAVVGGCHVTRDSRSRTNRPDHNRSVPVSPVA